MFIDVHLMILLALGQDFDAALRWFETLDALQ
jgi:hypothetical protein